MDTRLLYPGLCSCHRAVLSSAFLISDAALQANWPDVGFAVPLAPLLMSCSIFGDAFLLLSLGQKAILRFFIVLGIVLVLYVVYGVHGATRHDAQLADYIAAR